MVLHHIAESYGTGRRWLDEMARGDGVTDTAAMVDEANAAHAERAGSSLSPETVALLEDSGARLEATLRAFSDEELDRSAPFGPAGGSVSHRRVGGRAGAQHREHLSHARRPPETELHLRSVGVEGGAHLVGLVRP